MHIFCLQINHSTLLVHKVSHFILKNVFYFLSKYDVTINYAGDYGQYYPLCIPSFFFLKLFSNLFFGNVWSEKWRFSYEKSLFRVITCGYSIFSHVACCNVTLSQVQKGSLTKRKKGRIMMIFAIVLIINWSNPSSHPPLAVQHLSISRYAIPATKLHRKITLMSL